MKENSLTNEPTSTKKSGDFNALLDSSSMVDSRGFSDMQQKHYDSMSGILKDEDAVYLDDKYKYDEEEENLICARFPHLSFCLCKPLCQISFQTNPIFEVFDGILLSNLHGTFMTKQLIEMKVKRILNVSCSYYTQRRKYFEYLDIDIQDSMFEDAQRHFRITNRYIENGRQGGRILIHSFNGTSRAPTFILAYLISREKIKLNEALVLLRSFNPKIEPNENFMKQLIDYDLEQLAKNEKTAIEMESEELKEFTVLSQNFIKSGSEQERKQAEQAINQICVDLTHLQNLFYFLEVSNIAEVKIMAANCIKKVIENNWNKLQLEIKIQLKTQIIQFLGKNGPLLDIRVNKAIIFIIAFLVKKAWFEDPVFREIISEYRQFMQASYEHCMIALVSFEQLIMEMTIKSKGKNLASNRRISISFRDNALYEILEVTVGCLKECWQVDNKQPLHLINQCMTITHQCFTYDFCAILLDETLEDPQSTMIPSNWRNIIISNNLLQMFAHIFFQSTSDQIQLLGLLNINDLVNCKIGFFKGNDERQQFLKDIIEILMQIYIHPIIRQDGQLLFSTVEILNKLVHNFRFKELEEKNILNGFLEATYTFTISCLSEEDWLMDTGKCICIIWNKIVQEIFHVCPALNKVIDQYIYDICYKFIEGNLRSSSPIGLSDNFELEERLDQMTIFDIFAKLSSHSYDQILPKIKDQIEELGNNQELWRDPNGENSVELENKLGWLIKVVAAVFGIKYLNPNNFREDEATQFEICAHILKLIQLSSNNQINKCHFSEDLEVSLILFMKQFGKSVLGNPKTTITTSEGENSVVSFTSNDFAKICELMKLPNILNVVEIIVQKILYNLLTFSNNQELIKCTIQLFKSLVTGYNTSKLLMQSASVKDMLQNHLRNMSLSGNFILTPEIDCVLYEIMSSFMLEEDNASNFGNYLQSFQGSIQNILSANEQDPKTALQIRTPLLRLLFCLKGILQGLKNSKCFNIFFEWIYPDNLLIIFKGLRLFPEDSQMMSALLKFQRELVFNRVQRLRFDLNDINGFLLFKQTSRFIIDFAGILVTRQVQTDLYREKYKFLYLSIRILMNCLQGNYINFGVFKLYEDFCFLDSVKVLMNLIIRTEPDHIMQYEKLQLGIFGFFCEFTKNHSSLLLLEMGEVIPETIIKLLLNGVLSDKSETITFACHALDNIQQYIFNTLMSLTAKQPLKESIQAMFNMKQKAFTEILTELLRALLRPETNEYWILVRPLLSAFLLNEQYAEMCFQSALNDIERKNVEAASRIREEFKTLLGKINTRDLLPKTRDKFAHNLHLFKLSLKEIL